MAEDTETEVGHRILMDFTVLIPEYANVPEDDSAEPEDAEPEHVEPEDEA